MLELIKLKKLSLESVHNHDHIVFSTMCFEIRMHILGTSLDRAYFVVLFYKDMYEKTTESLKMKSKIQGFYYFA